jgi:hypothetical protein
VDDFTRIRNLTKSTESDAARAAYQRAMDELELVVGSRTEPMAAWQHLRHDLVSAYHEATTRAGE